MKLYYLPPQKWLNPEDLEAARKFHSRFAPLRPISSIKKEKDLITQVQAGNENALDVFTKTYMPRVLGIAKRYVNRGLALDDLLIIGWMGLHEAAKTTDIDVRSWFFPFAKWKIKWAILNAIDWEGHAIRLPTARRKDYWQLRRAEKHFDRQKIFNPPIEIQTENETTKPRAFLQIMNCGSKLASLDSKLKTSKGEQGSTLYDLVPAKEQGVVEKRELAQKMERILANYNESNKKVIEMYFGLNSRPHLTTKEIGEKLKLTRESVYEIINKTAKSLKITSKHLLPWPDMGNSQKPKTTSELLEMFPHPTKKRKALKNKDKPKLKLGLKPLFDAQIRLRDFHSDQTARRFFERNLWPDGPICPHCGNTEKAYKLKYGGKDGARKGLWTCAYCRTEFTVTVGTLFETSHAPLHKWLFVLYSLKLNAGKVNMLHLQRTIETTYRTIWWMVKHLKEAMACEGVVLPKLPYKERVKNQGGV